MHQPTACSKLFKRQELCRCPLLWMLNPSLLKGAGTSSVLCVYTCIHTCHVCTMLCLCVCLYLCDSVCDSLCESTYMRFVSL